MLCLDCIQPGGLGHRPPCARHAPLPARLQRPNGRGTARPRYRAHACPACRGAHTLPWTRLWPLTAGPQRTCLVLALLLPAPLGRRVPAPAPLAAPRIAALAACPPAASRGRGRAPLCARAARSGAPAPRAVWLRPEAIGTTASSPAARSRRRRAIALSPLVNPRLSPSRHAAASGRAPSGASHQDNQAAAAVRHGLGAEQPPVGAWRAHPPSPCTGAGGLPHPCIITLRSDAPAP